MACSRAEEGASTTTVASKTPEGPAAKAVGKPAGKQAAKQPKPYAEIYAEVDKGTFDPLTIPFEDGIVWYGTWEDAMAEKERTGKPVMLHFGSPRCPSGDVCVPGTW